MTVASMTAPGEVGRGTSFVRRTASQRMRLAKPLAASELVRRNRSSVGRDVAEQAEMVAMDLRLVLRARVPEGHVVPGVAQDRRERRAVARHAREQARELGLERQRPRLLGMAHEVAGDALARGHARDQQVADRVGPPEDVGGDAVGGALAPAEGRGPDEHGVELGRLHRALVEPARVTAGDPEHRQQRGQDADRVGLGVGLDRVGDLAEDAVDTPLPPVATGQGSTGGGAGLGASSRRARNDVLLGEGRRGRRPVAAVLEDGVDVGRACSRVLVSNSAADVLKT